MNFARFSSFIKAAALIPVLIGVLTFAEAFLPYQTIETKVISKRESFRIKTGQTTYSINFDGLNDQFSENVYYAISEGDLVTVKATFFHKEIRELERSSDNVIFKNDTSEPIFLFGFAIVFLLAGLSWFKSGDLSNGQAKFVSIIILLSLATGGRLIVMNYF